MQGDGDNPSLQGLIPSTRLEPSSASVSFQLSGHPSTSQQQQQQRSSSSSSAAAAAPRLAPSEPPSCLQLHTKVEALTAAAQATNSILAEVHIIGELSGGHGFNERCGIFCEVKFVAGSDWTPLCREALETQQTQTAYASPADVYVWSHPVNLHYALSSLVGWPSCFLSVWKMDSRGRASPLAFGSTCLPMAAGEHEVVCHTWAPVGAAGEELAGRMFSRKELLGEASWPSTGDPSKTQLVTRTSGRVLLRLSVATRYFEALGICAGPIRGPSANAAAQQEERLGRQLKECRQLFRAYLEAQQRGHSNQQQQQQQQENA